MESTGITFIQSVMKVSIVEMDIQHGTLTSLLLYTKFHLYNIISFCSTTEGAGKAVPLQAWSGPEGSRKLRFPDSMTTAQEGGKVVSLTHRPNLPPGNSPGTHFC